MCSFVCGGDVKLSVEHVATGSPWALRTGANGTATTSMASTAAQTYLAVCIDQKQTTSTPTTPSHRLYMCTCICHHARHPLNHLRISLHRHRHPTLNDSSHRRHTSCHKWQAHPVSQEQLHTSSPSTSVKTNFSTCITNPSLLTLTTQATNRQHNDSALLLGISYIVRSWLVAKDVESYYICTMCFRFCSSSLTASSPCR